MQKVAAKDNKILILTLGTGTGVLQREYGLMSPKDLFDCKNNIYIKTEYRINGDRKNSASTPFVAKPLIEKMDPDVIIIVGTVKSAWSGIYKVFSDEKKRNLTAFTLMRDLETMSKERKRSKKIKCKSCEIELQDDGNNVSKKVLGEIQEVIQKRYKDAKVFQSLKPGVKVKVLLTRYGMDDKQLLENYGIITAAIKDALDKKSKNVIAFDITHSFRSMPIYNLVILNYFKNVSKYNIEISNVFYGNFEIKSENNDVAPIIDLKDLIHTLDLTNGVSEFRNTGNSVTLMKAILEEAGGCKSNLYNALADFDFFVQINDYNKIVSALEKLLAEIDMPEAADGEEDYGKYADLKEMIGRVVIDGLLERKKGLVHKESDANVEDIPELQYLLCKWYLSQNRYGQAIATAIEVLRSYLVQLYVKEKNKGVTLETCGDKHNRRDAVVRLEKIPDVKTEDISWMKAKWKKAASVMYEIKKLIPEATDIRNCFAHNLSEKVEVIEGETEDEQVVEKGVHSREETESFIQGFIEQLGKLRKIFKDKNGHKQLYALYVESGKQKNKTGVKINGENVRLVISNDVAPVEIEELKKSKNKRHYSVYTLPDEIVALIGSDQKSNDYTIKNAKGLVQYIKRYFDVSSLQVVFDENINYRQKMHYSIWMRNEGIEKIKERILENETWAVKGVCKCQYNIVLPDDGDGFDDTILEKPPIMK